MTDVDENLTCLDHEEAGSKIIYHICNIDAKANFVIRYCGNHSGLVHHLKNYDSHVWMLTSIGNNVRYIDVTTVCEHLGPTLNRCLSGYQSNLFPKKAI